MTDFTRLLQEKQAALSASFAEHKFKPKGDKDDEGSEGAEHEKKEKKEDKKDEPGEMVWDKAALDKKAAEKKASQAALGAFADTVSRLTEKTAAIVREDHGTAAEQLYRNMVSSSMNFKLAGVSHEAFDQPDTLIKNAYELMINAAEMLDIPLT